MLAAELAHMNVIVQSAVRFLGWRLIRFSETAPPSRQERRQAYATVRASIVSAPRTAYPFYFPTNPSRLTVRTSGSRGFVCQGSSSKPDPPVVIAGLVNEAVTKRVR